MGFKVPKLSELSLEQSSIYELPTDQNWLIRGGPGTGKTVLAVMRGRQLANYHNVCVLVYNRPLKLYLENALENSNCKLYTYNEFVGHVYRVLHLGSYPQDDQRQPIYEEIKEDLIDCRILYDHIILDEAQDCPKPFLEVLSKITKHMTCFIDPNQEIFQTDCFDYLKTLCVEAPFYLTMDFRNTNQILRAAEIFCNDKKGRPESSRYDGDKPRLIHVNNRDMDMQYMKQADWIVQYCKANREKEIGIIVDYASLRRTYEALSEELEDIMPVQWFKTMVNTDFDFNETGVQIFSYGTMKGLEFDDVILPRFECGARNKDDPRVGHNNLYVAMTRARDNLSILYFNTYSGIKWINPFKKINDENIKFFQKEEI